MSTKHTITSVKARECLDSRGRPTLAVAITLADGTYSEAQVPSGASTGQHEACELRDGDPARFGGKGVLKAVHIAEHEAAEAVLGLDACDSQHIDQVLIELDGTSQKSRLGANVILGISLAAAQAAAQAQRQPLFAYLANDVAQATLLPVPLMNVVNGGAHASNKLSIQEFMLVPHGFDRFSESLRAGAEIFTTLGELLRTKQYSTAVGDEGGYAPTISSSQEVLNFLLQAIEKAGYKPGQEISLALDVAASEFYDETIDKYHFAELSAEPVSAADLTTFYAELCQNFPVVSIEDGLAEDDWDGWKTLTEKLSPAVQLVGDDLFVTNRARILQGVEQHVANAVLIKPNQIGSLTETLSAIACAHEHDYRSIISHRSGETENTFIADLAVACGSGQIKTGSACRAERTAKYNRLLAIESLLGSKAKFFTWPK